MAAVGREEASTTTVLLAVTALIAAAVLAGMARGVSTLLQATAITDRDASQGPQRSNHSTREEAGK